MCQRGVYIRCYSNIVPSYLASFPRLLITASDLKVKSKAAIKSLGRPGNEAIATRVVAVLYTCSLIFSDPSHVKKSIYVTGVTLAFMSHSVYPPL